MASQRVLVFAVGGKFAEVLSKDFSAWQQLRTSTSETSWSFGEWSEEVRAEVESCINALMAEGYTPPVLYRSEYVDLWSSGDLFQRVLKQKDCQPVYHLAGKSYEVCATWMHSSHRVKICDSPDWDETNLLVTRVNEAIDAWGEFSKNRLIIIVRIILGGWWEDDEVKNALQTVPSWWTEKR